MLYKDKIQADMAKELEEDEEILQEDQMKTLHLEKETVHESGTSNTISAKPVDVQNQKKYRQTRCGGPGSPGLTIRYLFLTVRTPRQAWLGNNG